MVAPVFCSNLVLWGEKEPKRINKVDVVLSEIQSFAKDSCIIENESEKVKLTHKLKWKWPEFVDKV